MVFRKLDHWLIVFQSSIFLFSPFPFLVARAMYRSKILKKKKKKKIGERRLFCTIAFNCKFAFSFYDF